MNTKRILTSAVLMLTLFLILTPQVFSFPPENAFKIVSENLNSDNRKTVYTRQWEVVPEAASDGTHILKFFSESSTPVCTITISLSGAIIWQETGQSLTKSVKNGLLITPGFPVPCDILPVNQKETEKIYKDKFKAGGRIFNKSYRVIRENVSLEKAKKNGWLEMNSSESDKIYMITVTDQKGGLVVKQLWPEQGNWWIYEETPYRRSRLITYRLPDK